MSKLEELIQELCPDGVRFKSIKEVYQRVKGTPITAGKMKEIENNKGDIRVFAGGKTVINAYEKDIPKANITRVPAVLVQSRGIIDVIYYEKPFTFKNEMWAYTHQEKISVKFLYYVFQIVKKGLKCNYETKSSNESLFRGKMNFSNQIKYNYAHKERCFVEYDDFNTNRIENILLKSTLELLYKKTISSKNKMDIKTFLNSFQDVNTSDNYKKDFDKIVIDRNTKDYQKALVWSKIFLMNKSFSSFSGSHVAFSLLFPMETLFESYIAFNISKLLKTTDYNVTIQDRRFYLFDKPTKKFALRPDIVIHNDESCHPIIIDTKWKLLAENKINCGISQIDMYQMYAYHKKFNVRKVILVYPKAEQFISNKKINYYSQDGVDIRINFVDLFNLNNSLINIIDLLD